MEIQATEQLQLDLDTYNNFIDGKIRSTNPLELTYELEKVHNAIDRMRLDIVTYNTYYANAKSAFESNCRKLLGRNTPKTLDEA